MAAFHLLQLSGISDDLVVKTAKGKIQGFESTTSNGKKVSAWYSIPYAQPPVGNLRFRHPRSMDSWEGTKNTLDAPNSCVQADDTMWPGFSGSAVWGVNTNKSEDCLYLNVVVPRPHPKEPAAVILWIELLWSWSRLSISRRLMREGKAKAKSAKRSRTSNPVSV